jgi:rsbT co-antagonist protein RsbR
VPSKSKIAEVLDKREQEIATGWLERQSSSLKRLSAAEQQEIGRQSREFLKSVKTAAQGNSSDASSQSWTPVRDFLVDLSAARAKSGYTASETASFIFSMKQPVFEALRQEVGNNSEELARETWSATELLDSLGLLITESFQKTREEVISRQQQELLELSTPVVQLWDGILALPLIGTFDSARTQVVMQNLLEAIVKTRSDYAIIDITGVPIVDTLVAQHLLKTVAAARLMGAECMISGIRPQIAQTIIHLGVDLSDVITKATLADAFALTLRRAGYSMIREQKVKQPAEN